MTARFFEENPASPEYLKIAQDEITYCYLANLLTIGTRFGLSVNDFESEFAPLFTTYDTNTAASHYYPQSVFYYINEKGKDKPELERLTERIDFAWKNFSSPFRDKLVAMFLNKYSIALPEKQQEIREYIVNRLPALIDHQPIRHLISPGLIGPLLPEAVFTIKLVDNSGKTHLMGDLIKDDKTHKYIDFWASWCLPCIKGFNEYPALMKLPSQPNFLFISIDKDQDHKVWLAADKKYKLHKYGMSYRVATDADREVLKKALDVHSIPRYMYLDPNNEVKNFEAPRPTEVAAWGEYVDRVPELRFND